MGVYIKGMEMPTNCYECTIKSWDGEDDVCPFSGISALSIGRQDGCPLVPVPPHGRLIDADALDAGLKEMSEIEWNQKASPVSWAHAFDTFRDIIERDEPTIIPADSAEEGE